MLIKTDNGASWNRLHMEDWVWGLFHARSEERRNRLETALIFTVIAGSGSCCQQSFKANCSTSCPAMCARNVTCLAMNRTSLLPALFLSVLPFFFNLYSMELAVVVVHLSFFAMLHVATTTDWPFHTQMQLRTTAKKGHKILKGFPNN